MAGKEIEIHEAHGEQQIVGGDLQVFACGNGRSLGIDIVDFSREDIQEGAGAHGPFLFGQFQKVFEDVRLLVQKLFSLAESQKLGPGVSHLFPDQFAGVVQMGGGCHTAGFGAFYGSIVTAAVEQVVGEFNPHGIVFSISPGAVIVIGVDGLSKEVERGEIGRLGDVLILAAQLVLTS